MLLRANECRFLKPVYPGMTCYPGPRPGVAKGIVKFLVDVYDETGETVAIATILTMVKKLDQN